MSSMGHYHAQSDEPLTPEEMALAKRLFSDPMLVNNTALLQWIRDYIQVQPCCGEQGAPRTGHSNALLVKGRATSWYGLGDGSTADGGTVINYGGGTNGSNALNPLTDPHSGTPGTVGDASGWSLQEDAGSWTGEKKTSHIPGGYEQTPGVSTFDEIHTANGFSVNAWVKWNGYGIEWDEGPGQLKQQGDSAIWGNRSAGNQGFWLDVMGDLALNPAPFDPTSGDLRFTISDGTDGLTLDAGQGVVDGGWHMVTVTFDGVTREAILYIDGGDVTSGVYTGADLTQISQQIGMVNYGGFLGASGGNWGLGFIDEVGVWAGEVLTGGDIADLYAG